MSKRHLTDLSIAKLPHAPTYCVWDATFPSFGLRIGKRRKTFVLKQHNRYHIVGRYPITSLQQARNEAKRRLALKYFPDPTLPTPKAIERFLEARRPSLRPSSFSRYQLNLDHFPATPPLDQLKPHHLSLTAIPPAQANLRFAIFKAFLSWCREQGIIDRNPLQGIKSPNKRSKRDRLLTDDEIRDIWQESYNHNSFGATVRLLVLTGQRLNQIASARKEWIDRASNTIVFPAYIMKGNTEHTIPLTPLTHRHLQNHEPIRTIGPAMKKFRAQLTVPHFTLHDIRRYFSSTMAKLAVPIDITEALLSHTTGSRSPIQRTYDRYSRLEPMRSALQKYEAHLSTLCERLNIPEHP